MSLWLFVLVMAEWLTDRVESNSHSCSHSCIGHVEYLIAFDCRAKLMSRYLAYWQYSSTVCVGSPRIPSPPIHLSRQVIEWVFKTAPCKEQHIARNIEFWYTLCALPALADGQIVERDTTIIYPLGTSLEDNRFGVKIDWDQDVIRNGLLLLLTSQWDLVYSKLVGNRFYLVHCSIVHENRLADWLKSVSLLIDTIKHTMIQLRYVVAGHYLVYMRRTVGGIAGGETYFLYLTGHHWHVPTSIYIGVSNLQWQRWRSCYHSLPEHNAMTWLKCQYGIPARSKERYMQDKKGANNNLIFERLSDAGPWWP